LVVVRGWEEKHGWDRTLELVALRIGWRRRRSTRGLLKGGTGRFSASILLVLRRPDATKESTSMHGRYNCSKGSGFCPESWNNSGRSLKGWSQEDLPKEREVLLDPVAGGRGIFEL